MKLRHACLLAGLLAACTAPSATAPNRPTTGAPVQPIAGGPVLLRADITLRRVLNVPPGAIKVERNPVDGAIYVLHPNQGLGRIDLERQSLEWVSAASAILPQGGLAGLAFGPDGTAYVSLNIRLANSQTQAVIRRGRPDGVGFTWDTLATTAPYPLSNTFYDHLWNAMLVSPDGEGLWINAGSRTDHGEVQTADGAHPGQREVALTAKIMRLPTNATDLLLANDEAKLEQGGYIYARGVRNAYDLALAPTGQLFAVDNGPDADYADELNLIVANAHYGFPWRMGAEDNEVRLETYDPARDPRLNNDFSAVAQGFYVRDPDFPPVPGAFVDPIANLGPAATQARAPDGSVIDLSQTNQRQFTFTPHRSPLGLVFIPDSSAFPIDLRPAADGLSALVLSWGAAGGTFTDQGQDLLYLRLTRQGDSYQAVTVQLATGFRNPIDSVLIDNRLFVLDYGGDGALWELTFDGS